jgi:uncharacterized protein
VTCPICAKETDPKYRPFCSRRCADVDLGRWLTGSYAIPAEAAEDDDLSSDDARFDDDPPPRPQ